MKPRPGIIFIAAFLLTAAAAAASISSANDPASPSDPGVNIEDAPSGMRRDTPQAPVRLKVKTPVVVKIVDTPEPISVIAFLDIILIGAEIGLSFFIIGWAFSFIRKKIEIAARPGPCDTARRELAAIKAAKKNIAPREFCSRISLMIRSYIFGEFRKGSSELTTAEFLESFNTIPAVSDSSRQTMKSLLSLCDLVKFSGYEPSPGELEEAVESAGSLITALSGLKTERKLKGAP